ncbi:MAG TPA: hypothetical protein VL979_05575 [Solirubrobacteraceae bacterium]|nr:hypothetical protein [Solirubrobacteraceae bacterium]
MSPRRRTLVALTAAAVLLSFAAPAAGQGSTTTTPAAAAKTVAASAASPPLPSSTLESAAGQGGIEVGPGLPRPPAPAQGGSVNAGKASHPGFFDIPGQIEAAINEWFAGLVTSALNPAMKLVGETLLSTPQIASQADVRSYWQLAVGIADALLVLVVMVAGALVMTHESLQTSYALKDAIPRLVIAAIATNASLSISGQMVSIANVLSGALLGNGVDPQQAGHTLELLVVDAITGGDIFLTLLGLACAVLAVALLILYLVRAALIVFLVCAAPLCLLAHGLPQTEGLARLWWRAMFGALGVQVAQSLTLAAIVHVFFASSNSVLGLSASGALIDLLLVICLFYVLLRIPFWVRELVFSGRPSTVGRVAKTYIAYRVVRGAIGGAP